MGQWQSKRISILVVMSLCSGLWACNPSSQTEESKERDELALSYRLIDQGRAHEAVELLKPEVEQRPNRPEYRVALASAYSSLAGLHISKFHSFAESIIQNRPPSPSRANLISSGIESLAQFVHTIERFDRLPDVNETQLPFLVKAVETMEALEAPSRGQSLYRGILRAVHLKFLLYSQYLPRIYIKKNRECLLNLSQLEYSSQEVVRRGVLIVMDLKISYPKKYEELHQIQIEMQRVGAQIEKWLLEAAGYAELFTTETSPEPPNLAPENSESASSAQKPEKKVSWTCD